MARGRDRYGNNEIVDDERLLVAKNSMRNQTNDSFCDAMTIIRDTRSDSPPMLVDCTLCAEHRLGHGVPCHAVLQCVLCTITLTQREGRLCTLYVSENE